MISKRVLTALAVVLIAGLAGAQSEIRWTETPRVGIAVEDGSSAPLVNLAAQGTGNAGGMGWSGYYDGSDEGNHTFHTSLGGLSYAYRGFDGVNDHEFGLGFPVIDGWYMGSGLRWIPGDGVGVNAHTLVRPTRWLSVGIKGESLNRDPWMEWGVGLRPLFFSDALRSRLTGFYDGRVNPDGSYASLAAGLRGSPLDGLEVYGHWDFRDEKLVTGINLSFSRFMLGGEGTVYGDGELSEGNVQSFTSFKRLRGFHGRPRTLVVYDVAQVITDTPRPFGAVRDFGPAALPVRSLYEFLMDVEELIEAPDVAAVLFDRQAFFTSFSNLLEIERALLRLKESGKAVYFYDDVLGSTKYALAASVADGVFLSPQGVLDLGGFGITRFYFKDLLAEYGVEIRNFRSHEYKTAFDSLSESDMSDAQRESLESVYGELQDEMDRMIETGRSDRLDGRLDDLYADGYWMSADRALKAGLVDRLMYFDQLDEWVRNERYRVEPFSRRARPREYDWRSVGRPNVAVIYANGGMMMGEGVRGSSIGAESLASAIREARLNPMVDAVVLRVNSGGGSALASDIIAREVALCAEGPRSKPVVVSMAGVAASGGYMIAAPGAEILATPATITGSIGVIAIIPDVSGLLEKYAVGSETVTTAESADTPNIFRPLSESEEERIRRSVMERYDTFIELVALERDMEAEDVDAVAQGRIWTGEQAVDRGLVDGIGGLADALDLAESLAGVRDARVLEINPGRMGWLMPGMPNVMAAFLGLEKPSPTDLLPDDLEDVIEFYRSLAAYERGEALYMMPYTLEEMGLIDEE